MQTYGIRFPDKITHHNELHFMTIFPNEEHRHQDGIAGLTGSPKTMFILGLSVGVGSMAVLALIFLITMFMQGTGAFAFGSKADDEKIAAAAPAETDPEALQEQAVIPVPDVTDADHVRGNANAKVTLIEYSDFECPYCSRHLETIRQLLEDYPNDVRFVYRHFPLSFHANSETAADASECAGFQGKFWEMHDALFALADSDGLSEDGIEKLASDIGLNMADFTSCMENGDGAAKVSKDYQEGIAAGVTGTPATFVNGQIVEGAYPYETFEEIVQSEGAAG
jgi:protein-disulfide isomerase